MTEEQKAAIKALLRECDTLADQADFLWVRLKSVREQLDKAGFALGEAGLRATGITSALVQTGGEYIRLDRDGPRNISVVDFEEAEEIIDLD